MPRVTAIILTYNRLTMLKRAVASALWQTHDDLEVLIVANGSGQDTLDWLDTVDDPRVKVIALEENISPPLARNEGITRATGDWIANLDDDDLWAPDKVAAMVSAAEQADRRWVYCGVVFIDPDGQVIAGRPLDDPDRVVRMLPVAYTIPGGLSGVMWRRDAMSDGGLMDDLPYTGDWDIALRLVAEGEPARVDRPLVGYRQHPGSWSRGVDDDRHEFDRVVEKHAVLRAGKRAHWGEHYRYVAAHAGRAGARGEAIRLYLTAIRHGDWRSIPRLFGSLLPLSAQRFARRLLLSDRSWTDEAAAWLAALHNRS